MRLDLSRVAERDSQTPGGGQQAAVLVAVVDRPEGDHLLFIRRADDLSSHAGQMSFPGGGHEPGDADLRETALREAKEEAGIRPESVDVVGRLDGIYTITDYSVTPYVGRVPDEPYEPDGREATAVTVLPVAEFVAAANYEFERRVHPEGGEVVVHYFHVGDVTVWGATGDIVVTLLERTTDWRAPEHNDGYA